MKKRCYFRGDNKCIHIFENNRPKKKGRRVGREFYK